MIYWCLQLTDLLVFKVFHLFALYAALCWLIWAVRVFASSFYRHFVAEGEARYPATVIVPTFHEDLHELKSNLITILRSLRHHDEVLVVFDERDPSRAEFDLQHPQLRVLVAPPGKRPAIAAGARAARNMILIITGSDTRFRYNTIVELVKPFEHPSVGGVCGRVVPRDTRGIGARCYKWALSLRNIMIYPGLSCRGTVHVLNGECYAVRRDIAVAHLDDFCNQVFLKRRYDSGDDGWMTTIILKHGYRTLYQDSAIALTKPPASLHAFLVQQLRWNRNSTRRSLQTLTQEWAWKRGTLYPFHLLGTLVRAPFWLLILLLAFVRLFTQAPPSVVTADALQPVWSDWRLLLLVVGLIFVRGLRALPYLLREPGAVRFLPLYAFIAPFLLAPLKFVAMVTVRNSAWLTRGSPSRSEPVAMLVCVLVLTTLLLLYPILALATSVVDDDATSY